MTTAEKAQICSDTDAASCPDCGGNCTKELGHSGAHRCGSCGHEWY